MDFGRETVFYLFNLPIRDTVVSTWVMMVIVSGLAIWIGKREPVALEMLFDFLNDTISDVMGRSGEMFLPMLGSLAIFIAFANVNWDCPIFDVSHQ